MRDSEGLGWLFDKTDLGRIAERVDILVALFSFKKARRQKLALADGNAQDLCAIEDAVLSSSTSYSSSSSSDSSPSSPSSTNHFCCNNELVQGLVHPGDGRNSAQLSQLVAETSSSSDPRRDPAVSYSVRLEPDVPQGVDDFI